MTGYSRPGVWVYPGGVILDALSGTAPLLAGPAQLLAGFIKGISYGLLVWFFRVVMSVISQWMMYKVPWKTLGYTLLAGLVEMLVLGILYGLTLHPTE